MLLFGLGMGVVFVPLTTVSLAGVRPEESGAASSMVNVMQQVGGALGLAILVAVYGTASRSAAAHPIAGLTAVAQQHHVLAHGMSAAFGLAAIFDAVTLLLVITVIRGRRRRAAEPGTARRRPRSPKSRRSSTSRRGRSPPASPGHRIPGEWGACGRGRDRWRIMGRVLSVDKLAEVDRARVWHPYAPMPGTIPPLPVVSASGVRLRLASGAELVDGMSSWWAAVHGYAHPALDAAVRSNWDG